MKKLLVLMLIAGCFSVFASPQAHWGYIGDQSPENWGKLMPEFSLCSEGQNQAPVNINGALDTIMEPLKFDYQPGQQSIVNNGHTIQINVNGGSSLIIDGEKFELKQFHFHSPSENEINGQSFPLEAHFVHSNSDGELLVLALMFTAGDDNVEMAKVWNQLPTELNIENPVASPIAIISILPEDRSYYRFSGSLTTPPCTEGVRWLVLKTQVSASAQQIKQFELLMHHHNNRPVQPLHGRVIVG